MNESISESATVQRPVVFFDGGCPICRREIAFYQRLDRKQAVDWRDIVADPGVLEGSGIPWDTAMRRFHVLDPQGRTRSGVDGFAVVWDHLPYWHVLARLVRGLGLLKPLDALYTWYAARRYRKRCGDGSCGI